jgi:hypothetical protein
MTAAENAKTATVIGTTTSAALTPRPPEGPGSTCVIVREAVISSLDVRVVFKLDVRVIFKLDVRVIR